MIFKCLFTWYSYVVKNCSCVYMIINCVYMIFHMCSLYFHVFILLSYMFNLMLIMCVYDFHVFVGCSCVYMVLICCLIWCYNSLIWLSRLLGDFHMFVYLFFFKWLWYVVYDSHVCVYDCHRFVFHMCL